MAKFAKVERTYGNPKVLYINIENISHITRGYDCWVIKISGEDLAVKELPECLQQSISEL